VNSFDDPAYRLQLASGYLAKAERDAIDGQWDDCLANAQEAVENAGKTILCHFRPAPKTHDVLKPLIDLLEQAGVPETIRQKVHEALDAFRGMGLETHIRATYGNENTRTPPWELIQESEAMAGLEKARRAVALAEAIYAEMTKSASD
jgi:HEPN domain-containing protein